MHYNGVRKYTSTGRKKRKDEITASYYSEFMYRCKCSHTILMPYNIDHKVCDFCGNMVYKNKQAEFKDKMMKTIKRRNI